MLMNVETIAAVVPTSLVVATLREVTDALVVLATIWHQINDHAQVGNIRCIQRSQRIAYIDNTFCIKTGEIWLKTI